MGKGKLHLSAGGDYVSELLNNKVKFSDTIGVGIKITTIISGKHAPSTAIVLPYPNPPNFLSQFQPPYV